MNAPIVGIATFVSQVPGCTSPVLLEGHTTQEDATATVSVRGVGGE
jgi:hypothetical protein